MIMCSPPSFILCKNKTQKNVTRIRPDVAYKRNFNLIRWPIFEPLVNRVQRLYNAHHANTPVAAASINMGSSSSKHSAATSSSSSSSSSSSPHMASSSSEWISGSFSPYDSGLDVNQFLVDKNEGQSSSSSSNSHQYSSSSSGSSSSSHQQGYQIVGDKSKLTIDGLENGTGVLAGSGSLNMFGDGLGFLDGRFYTHTNTCMYIYIYMREKKDT
jgi:hypothetical protein